VTRHPTVRPSAEEEGRRSEGGPGGVVIDGLPRPAGYLYARSGQWPVQPATSFQTLLRTELIGICSGT
jgi:hypothetical protein